MNSDHSSLDVASLSPPSAPNFDGAQRAQIISEVLPYLRRWHGQTVVIKYGGAAMTEASLKAQVMGDIALLHYAGVKIVVVHGGGPEISAACQQMGIEPQFVGGLRVTDEATMRVTEMVMGQIGKSIAQLLNEKGAPAVGLSGKDANLLQSSKLQGEHDWGLVGEINHVDATILNSLTQGGFVPVVTPISPGEGGATYNINADFAAAALATALGASKLLLLTDVPGIYRDFSDQSTLLDQLTIGEAEELIESGAVSRGMIPKVRCCINAVRDGVSRAHIVDGRAPHAILIELFTEQGCGTMIST
jgi:acetylglutamate kinase